jgi:DNA-binding GntR family transcriptional regulator
VPVPEQIAAVLRAEIDAGHPNPGQTLPRLGALAARFDVSQATVTRALRILRTEGLVGGRGRRGLVVLRKPRRRGRKPMKFFVPGATDGDAEHYPALAQFAGAEAEPDPPADLFDQLPREP